MFDTKYRVLDVTVTITNNISCYISALPFLKRTTVLLWPVTAAIVIYVVSLIMKWNFTLFLCHFYQFRLF